MLRNAVKDMFSSQEPHSCWLQTLTIGAIVTIGSLAAAAQSSTDWLRHYRGKYAADVTRDPRFAAEIRHLLVPAATLKRVIAAHTVPDAPGISHKRLSELNAHAPVVYGNDLVEAASAYMTNSSDDAVQVQGEQVTVEGCANHGVVCSMLWSVSKKSAAQTPQLALCIIGYDLWIYTSSQSIATVPPQLRKSIQSWRTSVVEDGFNLHPKAAFLVTRDGQIHPLDLDTLNPQIVK